jgi:hypothetical protein
MHAKSNICAKLFIQYWSIRLHCLLKINRSKVGVFFDVYNITNTNAEQLTTSTSGSAFLRPTAITSPRIARVGVKFDF